MIDQVKTKHKNPQHRRFFYLLAVDGLRHVDHPLVHVHVQFSTSKNENLTTLWTRTWSNPNLTS